MFTSLATVLHSRIETPCILASQKCVYCVRLLNMLPVADIMTNSTDLSPLEAASRLAT
jgi:hypothetical protein